MPKIKSNKRKVHEFSTIQLENSNPNENSLNENKEILNNKLYKIIQENEIDFITKLNILPIELNELNNQNEQNEQNKQIEFSEHKEILQLFKNEKSLYEEQSVNKLDLSFPHSLSTYKDYLLIHETWKEYVSSIPRPMLLSGVAFAKLEFVGAKIKIEQAINPMHIGKMGIIVDETMHKFYLITSNNKKLKIDKKMLVFKLEGMEEFIQCHISIHGNRLIQRPIERSTKKFKS